MIKFPRLLQQSLLSTRPARFHGEVGRVPRIKCCILRVIIGVFHVVILSSIKSCNWLTWDSMLVEFVPSRMFSAHALGNPTFSIACM
jgi:hypothetical protein